MARRNVAYHEQRSEHRSSCITGGNARPCARSSVRLPSFEQKCSRQAATAAQTSSTSSFRCRAASQHQHRTSQACTSKLQQSRHCRNSADLDGDLQEPQKQVVKPVP